MTMQWVYKPTRSTPRYFKPCDVARIARNVRDDNQITPDEILLCTALGLDYYGVAILKTEDGGSGGLKKLSERIVGTLAVVRKGVMVLRDGFGLADDFLNAILEFIPDELEDTDNPVFKALKRRLRGSKRRILAATAGLRKARDGVEDVFNSLTELGKDIDKLTKIIDKIGSIEGVEVLTALDVSSNCKCKREKPNG